MRKADRPSIQRIVQSESRLLYHERFHDEYSRPYEKIISLYSRGMTQREIQGQLEEIYGVEVSSSETTAAAWNLSDRHFLIVV